MSNLMSLLLILVTAVGGAVTTAADPPQHFIVQSGDDEPLVLRGTVTVAGDDADVRHIVIGAPHKHARYLLSAAHPMVLHAGTLVIGDEDDQKKIIIGAASEEPQTVIGVRVSTMPEPLAAHLKCDGLMIANVAKDGPADQAGLERYDIVVRFGDRPIADMDDLLEAIRDSGAGSAVEMVVISGGQEKTLEITPVKRDKMGSWAFKYEEPEADEVDQLQRYFGHRLKVGPHGTTMVLPHGRLDKLPPDVKDMLKELPDVDWDEWADDWENWAEHWEDWAEHWAHWAEQWQKLDLPVIPHAPGLRHHYPWPHADLDLDARITISIEEDGERLRIERDKDGTITIERETADGDRSSATYDSPEEMEEGDPEAYEVYRKHVALPSPGLFITTPDLKKLGVRQKQFQIELKHQLDKAREQLERAKPLYERDMLGDVEVRLKLQLEEARRQMEKAQEAFEKARKRLEIRKESVEESDVSAGEKTVTLRVDEDEHITLVITEDGATKRYEFDSREDFRKSRPELYERYGKHLDQ